LRQLESAGTRSDWKGGEGRERKDLGWEAQGRGPRPRGTSEKIGESKMRGAAELE
jgi:hypothetical protein